MTIKVNCWNEYDQLKTVILGNTYDLNAIPRLYEDRDQDAFCQIIEETHEDLKGIQQVLEQNGVQVLRPTQPANYNQVLGRTTKYHSPLMNMRDFHMAYGNMFFMTYSGYRYRRFQHAWLEDITNQMIADGNLVIAANELNLSDDLPRNVHHEESFEICYESEEGYAKKNLIHCAAILKHNRTAFMHARPGTPIGKTWMTNWLAQQGIEVVEVPGYGHIDTFNAIIREDTIITNDPDAAHWQGFKNRILTGESYDLPKYLDIKMDIIQPNNWLYQWQGHFQKMSANTNSISISPNKLMVRHYDPNFFAMLESLGIEPILVNWRHGYFWGGGLHCMTCDIERVAS
jgi:N-dimethylarginine dimethylaminohydrolase